MASKLKSFITAFMAALFNLHGPGVTPENEHEKQADVWPYVILALILLGLFLLWWFHVKS